MTPDRARKGRTITNQCCMHKADRKRAAGMVVQEMQSNLSSLRFIDFYRNDEANAGQLVRKLACASF